MGSKKGALFFIVGLFCLSWNTFSQDTIKVMHYNLLYYGKNIYDCSSVNNAVDAKNGYLRTIIKHIKPDIFTVNELDGEDSYPVTDDASYLLNNALNVDGVTYYCRTSFPKTFLANTLFYNSQKLKLKKHTPLSFAVSTSKVFNIYTLYYNAPDLAITNDTVFITCIVAHLKAGSYASDILERSTEIGIVMDYIKSKGIAGNYLFMGDLNLYTSSEQAFQKLINPSEELYKFYDPANQIGDWNNNSAFRFVHTQSTHVSGDCFSSGGMDDRFDFILASESIMNGTQKVQYVTNTYKAIGQDGSSYNGSLNISSNTSVPSNVAQALYSMSDHLPVYLELRIDQTSVSDLSISNIYTNPVTPVSTTSTTINATLSDKKSVVQQMKILWGNSSGGYPNRVSMGLSDNRYSGSISQFPSGTNIYYKIAGFNSSDQVVVSSDEYNFTIANPVNTDDISRFINNLNVLSFVDHQLTISGFLIKDVRLKLEIIGVNGDVKYSQIKYLSAGDFLVNENVENITNGLYLVRLTSEDFSITEKIVIR